MNPDRPVVQPLFTAALRLSHGVGAPRPGDCPDAEGAAGFRVESALGLVFPTWTAGEKRKGGSHLHDSGSQRAPSAPGLPSGRVSPTWTAGETKKGGRLPLLVTAGETRTGF